MGLPRESLREEAELGRRVWQNPVPRGRGIEEVEPKSYHELQNRPSR
jgi:hypothetical protein